MLFFRNEAGKQVLLRTYFFSTGGLITPANFVTM